MESSRLPIRLSRRAGADDRTDHRPKMFDEYEDSNKEKNGREDNVQVSISSLHRLTTLESETLSTEIHLLGQLRDRLSPAARYAGNIPIKYRRQYHKMQSEAEHQDYLLEGFPFVERGKPLTGLLVIDKYSIVELEPAKEGKGAIGQYAGERLYLTHDRKWILAERVGAYSEDKGSTSEWEATCRIVTDRSLLERYSIDLISDGLFEATNLLWQKLSPRMDALKKRSEKAQQVTKKLAELKNPSLMRIGGETKETEQSKPQGLTSMAAAVNKIGSLGHS